MENKKQSNYTTKKCYCGVSYETYRNTASCCKLCQKEKHRVLAKQYARDNIKLSDGVKKSCVICNKPFTVKTNAVSCSKSCTDIRYLELNRITEAEIKIQRNSKAIRKYGMKITR